jgi:hypothetical protein
VSERGGASILERIARPTVPRRQLLGEHGLAALLSLAILAPLLRPGYVLSYDLVATPHVPFTAATLGWGDGLPRAVPQDAVVALLTTGLPGWLVQLVALVAAIWLAVVGAARLVPTDRVLIRLVAGAAYGWNAFVAERLVIGHWGLLLGYAALPWLVRAALAARGGANPTPVVAWGALAALTPTGGLLAAVTAAAVLCWPLPPNTDALTDAKRPARRLRLWALAVAALNAPWLVAGAVAAAGTGSDPNGVAAFAARAENWSGAFGALLGLGGIWNADVVPASRTSGLAPVFTLVVLVVAGAGLAPLTRAWGRRPAGAVVTVAAGALFVAAVGALPGGPRVLTALVDWVPGAGLLRDGQKFLPPYALLLAVCFALGVERLTARLAATAAGPSAPARLVAVGATVAALLFPVLVLPDLAWGSAGRLATERYPADWDSVAAKLSGQTGGELVTLPFSSFRVYPWNGGRTVLDPAARYFPVDVVVEDALPVGAGAGELLVAGESRRATAVRAALQDGRSLAALGIRWIVVERRTPGPVPAAALVGYRAIWTGPDLILYEATNGTASESVPEQTASPARVSAVLAGYGVAVGVLLGALVFSAVSGRRRRLARRQPLSQTLEDAT